MQAMQVGVANLVTFLATLVTLFYFKNPAEVSDCPALNMALRITSLLRGYNS